MKYYNNIKKFDVLSAKNIEESEERNETFTTVYFDSNNLNIKDIHNKRKDYR